MIILSLDIATRTGVALGRAGQKPRAISIDLGKGLSYGVRFANAIRYTDSLIRKHKPDLVVFEAAVGGDKRHPLLTGLAAAVQGQATVMQARVEPVAIASVRKHFLGRHLTSKDYPHLGQDEARQAIKCEVMRRCQILGMPVRDDDEADAVAIFDYASFTYGRAQPAPPGELFGCR